MISPAGSDAAVVARLWWVLLGTGVAVYLLTLVVLLVAVRRGPRSFAGGRPWSGARRMVIGLGVVLPVVVLVPLMALTVATGRTTHTPAEEAELVVEVTGHQFWWSVTYPEEGITSANELHVPVGRPVEYRLQAQDVVHSFWVPRLAGKLDMIPGRTNSYVFTADEPGVYEGICAEFCGIQHARMHFVLVAHEQEEYDAWLAARREAPEPPDDELAAEGRQVFLTVGCAACHAVRGTSESQVGPDLTDFASRRTIGAGLLDNVPGNRGGWVLDPQSLKRGSGMPPTDLTGPELQALLAYLDTLR